jgi:hypothetical protein
MERGKSLGTKDSLVIKNKTPIVWGIIKWEIQLFN